MRSATHCRFHPHRPVAGARNLACRAAAPPSRPLGRRRCDLIRAPRARRVRAAPVRHAGVGVVGHRADPRRPEEAAGPRRRCQRNHTPHGAWTRTLRPVRPMPVLPHLMLTCRSTRASRPPPHAAARRSLVPPLRPRLCSVRRWTSTWPSSPRPAPISQSPSPTVPPPLPHHHRPAHP